MFEYILVVTRAFKRVGPKKKHPVDGSGSGALLYPKFEDELLRAKAEVCFHFPMEAAEEATELPFKVVYLIAFGKFKEIVEQLEALI